MQWKYPPEFRIAPPALTLDLWRRLEALAAKVPPAADAVSGATPAMEGEDPAERRAQMRLLADIGTGLWRLRGKMIQPGTDQPREEMRRTYRHVQAIWDALAQCGVEIQDHTDEPFQPGMSLKVIEFQPLAGIERAKIIETLKPSIYFKRQRIQIGEVLVNSPAEGS